MDKWIKSWKKEWMNEWAWLYEIMHGWYKWWISKAIHAQMVNLMNTWMDEYMDGWTGG